MVLDQWIDLTNWAARWVCFDLSVVTLKSFVCSEHLHSWRFCLNLYHWLILISIARWTARCYFLKVKLIFHIMSIVKHLKWWVGRIWFTGGPPLKQFSCCQSHYRNFWLIYVDVGDFCVNRGPPFSPTYVQHGFFQVPNSAYGGDPLYCWFL